MSATHRLAQVVNRRCLHSVPDLPQNRVAILGACGALGQPLALMLKRSAFVSQLALYDIRDTGGLRADLGHIATKAQVSAYQGRRQLADCLKRCSLVVILAGRPRQPGMRRSDLFQQNAATVAELTAAVARHCPEALLCLLTSPLNSNTPLAAEILRRHGVHDPRRVFGVTAIDSVRANILVARKTGWPLDQVSIPVVGGHSGSTLVPLLSQAEPPCHHLRADERRALTQTIRGAADVVLEAKAGTGSASLSVAAATHGFVQSLLCAMDGQQNLVETAYVESDAIDGAEFCSNPLLLGQDGVERNLGIGRLSDSEAELLRESAEQLKRQIDQGRRFAQAWKPPASEA